MEVTFADLEDFRHRSHLGPEIRQKIEVDPTHPLLIVSEFHPRRYVSCAKSESNVQGSFGDLLGAE
jgi:hypothetical protein